MSTFATAIGALSTTGLEAYEVSQGAPVSISSVNGVGSVNVGSNIASSFSGFSGSFLILALAALVLYFVFRKD